MNTRIRHLPKRFFIPNKTKRNKSKNKKPNIYGKRYGECKKKKSKKVKASPAQLDWIKHTYNLLDCCVDRNKHAGNLYCINTQENNLSLIYYGRIHSIYHEIRSRTSHWYLS